MKKFIVSTIIFLSANGASFGALPPLYQNAAEIKAILNDPKLGNYLESGEMILEIKKTNSGWLIVTNHHELTIEILYNQSQMPGPVPFSINFLETIKTPLAIMEEHSS